MQCHQGHSKAIAVNIFIPNDDIVLKVLQQISGSTSFNRIPSHEIPRSKYTFSDDEAHIYAFHPT